MISVKFPRESGIVVFEVELIFTLRNMHSNTSCLISKALSPLQPSFEMSSNAPPKGLSGERCLTYRKTAAKETSVLGFFPEIMAAKEKKLALRDQ